VILGVDTLRKFGVILNFAESTITIDHHEITMRPLDAFSSVETRRHVLKRENRITHQVTSFPKAQPDPVVVAEATDRTLGILDAKYEKADLPKVIRENCSHLSSVQRANLLKLLQKYEELFDGSLGDFQTDPVSFDMNLGAKPYHGRAFPVPHTQKEVFKKEVERLVELGVLKPQPKSEWGSPAFIIAKKNEQVRFLTDFREVNKRIVRTPWPIPKIGSVLQELEGFTFATAIDLNMGYWTIRLDPDAQKICTIILPWGKYSYLRLPMGIAGSPDIFQEKMSDLMRNLIYVRTYLDDLLVITKGTFDDHLVKIETVFIRLQEARLRVNAPKCGFALHEIEYLGYLLTREGIKPQPEKVSAILAILPPKNVKELRSFLGVVQYYRDIWRRRSHLVSPLTDLVAECGKSKTKKVKPKKWYWTAEHQQAFDENKRTVSEEVTLAYPAYGELFEIYTDASTRQLGAVITQKGRPIAFFSRKLSSPQTKYSVTEQELLSIVECLKEFKGMLWGQKIKVYTDHQNLVRDALGLTSDRVYRWRLILEEYGPEIVYIPGVTNIVADGLSRLEYDQSINTRTINVHVRNKALAKTLRRYVEATSDYPEAMQTYDSVLPTGTITTVHGSHTEYRYSNALVPNVPLVEKPVYTDETARQQELISRRYLFANTSAEKEDEIYPVTVKEVAEAQRAHKHYAKYFKDANKTFKDKDSHISIRLISDELVLVYKEKRLVIPTTRMQNKVLQWYHHYLMHPGETRMIETLTAVMYWKNMRLHITKHVKFCDRCQRGKKHKLRYGLIPPKIATIHPWKQVSVDLIGPYTVRAKDRTKLDFMCLTMIDPATSWFEIAELPHSEVQYTEEGKEIKAVIDKTSTCIARLFNKHWLARYPRPQSVIYDNGSEFKLFFKKMIESFAIKHKPTTVKNPQANSILERVHQVVKNMIRTSELDMQDTCEPEMIDEVLSNVGWAIRSTYHTMLGSSPGSAVFGRDMLFDIPYIADWADIGKRRQKQVEKSNTNENKQRLDWDHKVGDKVLIVKKGIIRKLEDPNEGPYTITQVHTNGTVRIQRGAISERLHIRRLHPYFEK